MKVSISPVFLVYARSLLTCSYLPSSWLVSRVGSSPPLSVARPPSVAARPQVWRLVLMASTAAVAEKARSKWSVGGGLQTIPLDLLGTVPWNRGRLGVSSHHAHEVAGSIMADGFSRQRYRDATVVRVPEEALVEFRRFNKEMCEGDPQLPPFSPSMKFAALTKRLGRILVCT